MIALVTTYFLVFYILIPGALFRFLTSWLVPLKLFERTRTQEATFAVGVALLPFLMAVYAVWHLPVAMHSPFRIVEGTNAERRQDYHRVIRLMTASDASKLLGAAVEQAAANADQEANWRALNRVLRRQARFLSWFFIAVAGEALLFGFLARKYGNWQDAREHGWRRLRNAIYRPLARKILLPNISEWHMLLTDFNWPKQKDFLVVVDILQTDGLLYKGEVSSYFLDSNGKLTGILLKSVVRFDRQAFHDARDRSRGSAEDGLDLVDRVSADDFWKEIPSRNFYIGQSVISNLNVRFAPRDQTLISLAEGILERGQEKGAARSYDVEITSSADRELSDSNHPDFYS